MATNLGRVSLVPKGDYSSATTYKRMDLIQYNGRGYIVLANTIKGVTPVDGQQYMLLTDRGADGKTPVKGTDYWTVDDKQAMVNDVLAALPAAEGARF